MLQNLVRPLAGCQCSKNGCQPSSSLKNLQGQAASGLTKNQANDEGIGKERNQNWLCSSAISGWISHLFVALDPAQGVTRVGTSNTPCYNIFYHGIQDPSFEILNVYQGQDHLPKIFGRVTDLELSHHIILREVVFFLVAYQGRKAV